MIEDINSILAISEANTYEKHVKLMLLLDIHKPEVEDKILSKYKINKNDICFYDSAKRSIDKDYVENLLKKVVN